MTLRRGDVIHVLYPHGSVHRMVVVDWNEPHRVRPTTLDDRVDPDRLMNIKVAYSQWPDWGGEFEYEIQSGDSEQAYWAGDMYDPGTADIWLRAPENNCA